MWEITSLPNCRSSVPSEIDFGKRLAAVSATTLARVRETLHRTLARLNLDARLDRFGYRCMQSEIHLHLGTLLLSGLLFTITCINSGICSFETHLTRRHSACSFQQKWDSARARKSASDAYASLAQFVSGRLAEALRRITTCSRRLAPKRAGA